MKLKDFKILYIFSGLMLYDKNDNKIANIYNGFREEKDMQDYRDALFDDRTMKEKWNQYKDCEVLEIRNADIDINWQNNYIEIKLNLESKGE